MKIDHFEPIRVMRIIARMNVGGPAVQISGLMRGFDQSRFEQRLYTGYCGEDESDYLNEVAIDVIPHRVEGLGRRISLVSDAKVLIYMIREIRNFKPHIIHTHTAKAGVIGRLASLISLHKSTRIHTFHGHLLYGYFGPVKTRLVVFAERFLGSQTEVLVAVGHRVRAELLEAGIGKPEKFVVVPPGLSLGELIPKEVARKEFGLNSPDLVCGFVGRVTQIKRPDRFLDVVKELKIRGRAIQFIIAGDGELIEECRKRVLEENLPVTFLGWQNDISKVFSTLDLVILTSDNEGTPLSLIQAGLARLPVVSTNVGSILEVVQNGKTGFVTDKNVTSLTDAIEKLLFDPGLRQIIGNSAYEFTTNNFGVKRLVDDYQKLYLDSLI